MTYAIGVTGGIGCGKSSVAHLFAALGAAIIDTDEIAHRLTDIGQSTLTTIADVFGSNFIQANGHLDRSKMRRLVFSDPAAKTKLESILHPLIKQQVSAELGNCNADYALLIVPLLLETRNYDDLIQRILVVDCNEEQQIARTMARSNLSLQEVQAIMHSQISRNKRLELADDILVNNLTLENLKPQIMQLHQKYLQLASNA